MSERILDTIYTDLAFGGESMDVVATCSFDVHYSGLEENDARVRRDDFPRQLLYRHDCSCLGPIPDRFFPLQP